jgi:nucleoside-diphosphate-sugar epimerase
MQPSILILGCGYLGHHLLRQASAEGLAVDAITRNADTLSALKLSGLRHGVQATLSSPSWHPSFDPAQYGCIFITVGSSISTPEGYRDSYVDGLSSILEWAGNSKTPMLYTSSVSVYGPADGAWVDESTPTLPESWRGEILLESERLLQQSLPKHHAIFRLGGIYGPGRNRFLQAALAANRAVTASGPSWLNLIHVEDAASAMLQWLRTAPLPIGTFNLTDNQPIDRAELDEWVRIHCPPTSTPTSAVPPRPRAANRRIRSLRIQQALHWSPRYPNVLLALPELLETRQ